MSDPTVYLAGPVAAYDDGGARWRNAIKDEFSDVEFKDPLSKYNVPLDDLTADDIELEDYDPAPGISFEVAE